MTTTKVYLDLPPAYMKRGPHYTARLNGEVIVRSSMTPLLDAARVLLSRGVTGRVEMWDHERTYPRMSGDIEWIAGLSVEDSKFGTPVLRKFKRRVGARHQESANAGAPLAQPT